MNTPQVENEAVTPGDKSVWLKAVEKLFHNEKGAFTVFLVNGIKLNFSHIIDYDDFCFMAIDDRKDNSEQLVTYHAISTLVPNANSAKR